MKRPREGGFTLVEIIIALAVGAIIIAGMFQGFNTLQKWWVAAGTKSDQRQSARAGLETLTRDIEMAGYQTTTYGDPNKRGIAITFASAHEIEMDQQRPDSATIGSAAPVYRPRLVYYHLATDMNTGRQNLYRQIRTQPGLPSPDEIVAENIVEFSLAYFDKDSAPMAGLPPASPGGSAFYTAGVAVPANSPLRAIRRIQVTLTTTTNPARATPGAPPARDFTLTASVTPQNLAAADEVVVCTQPAVPTGLAVVDKHSCSEKLRVKWNPNAEPDIAGYLLFYGPTGSFNVPVRALVDRNDPRFTLNPDDLLITKQADRTTSPNTYSIQIAAYNSCGNHSAKSAPVGGNPSPDVIEFDQSPFADDSTVNPGKPAPPAGLTAAPGAAEGTLDVSWPPADSATAGYRLYRSTNPFTDGTHIGPAPPSIVLLADERTLTPDTTAFTDTGADLPEGKLVSCGGIGVTPTYYHYAVASVNCDETLVAGYRYNGSTPSLSDYAAGSGTPTPDSAYDEVGPDGTPCPPPSLAGSLPDYLRAFVTLGNPVVSACPDFDRTEILWSKSPAPPPDQDPVTRVVSGGTHVPDSDIGVAGTFRRRGNQVILFDSETEETPGSPSLTAAATYNLLAVGYDRCGNPSPAAGTSLTILAPTCVDDPPGPPPDSFSNARFSSCQGESVEISWDYPIPEPPGDFAGFHVERTNPDGTTVELTAGPTLLKSWVDAGPLQSGATYYYAVRAADCTYEADPVANSINATPPTTIGPAQLGRLQRYQPLSDSGHELDAANFVTTVSDQPAAYTYHNNVKFYLQNTSLGPKTIKRMAVTWDNPNVVLDSVVVGGSPSGTTARTFSGLAATSGASFAVDAEIDDVASGTASDQASDPVPVLLRFATPGGTVNRLTDMRSETLGLSLWSLDNPQPDGVVCDSPERLLIDAPRGPVLGGFSQSAPGTYGIDSYEVIGPSGTARDTDVKVPFGIPVNVFGTAFDNSRELFADGVNRGIAALKVVGISAAAADPAAAPAMPASGVFFERPLQRVSGDRYTISRTPPSAGDALMPQVTDKVVWYYALAVDRTGNWDRAPNPDAGSYAYFQPPFDVCTVTPLAPELTLTSASATEAHLSWTSPAGYDNGIAVAPDDTFTYDVYVKSSGGAPWPSVPAAAGLTGSSFVHSADLLAGTYYYMVRARNSCAAGPRPSGDSNVVMECQGPSNLDCTLFGVPVTARYGEPITLTMSDFCAYQGNGTADSVVFRVASGATTRDFTAPETGDAGAFAKTITAVYSGGGTDQIAAPSGTLGVDLVIGGATPCPARSVTLTGGPCSTVPKAPIVGSATRATTSTNVFTLTFTAPTQNTDNTPLLDLAGYRLLFSTSSTAPTTLTSSNSLDVGLITSPWTGAVGTSNRYYFWMQAYDTCGTRQYSATSSLPARSDR